jgi:hypothetical protein
MKKYFFFLLIFFMFAFSIGNSHATLLSSFDSGGEGWTGIDPSTSDWNGSWVSSGGNPGGYYQGYEPNALGGVGYWISPDTWDGDWSAYIGGTLSYDINILQAGGSYFASQDVRIYSGSDFVYWSGLPNNLPTNQWNTIEVPLIASTFTGSDFNAIMNNVTALWIRGELITGSEREGLDNVRVDPVPLPTAILLLGSGLIGCVGLRRKFKN